MVLSKATQTGAPRAAPSDDEARSTSNMLVFDDTAQLLMLRCYKWLFGITVATSMAAYKFARKDIFADIW